MPRSSRRPGHGRPDADGLVGGDRDSVLEREALPAALRCVRKLVMEPDRTGMLIQTGACEITERAFSALSVLFALIRNRPMDARHRHPKQIRLRRLSRVQYWTRRCRHGRDRSFAACSTKNSGVVPKKRERRKAVSTVTPLVSLTNLSMRVRGTLRRLASWPSLMSSGIRNSCFKISPGWHGFFIDGMCRHLSLLSAVVCNLEFCRTLFCPNQSNAPLTVDAYRVLAFPIAIQIVGFLKILA